MSAAAPLTLPEGRPPSWLVPAAAGISSLPVVVAAARAAAGGWLAIGDNANFLIRSRDVLTEHHPLLGTWTSASLAIGTNIDNPGPLYFDLLAVPAKIGGHAGLAIGVAMLNIACVGLIAWFATRNAGRVGGVAAMAMTAALAWTMGSELLYDPWQPHGLLFSVLLYLVLVWSMMSGDAIAAPAAVVVGSLIVQTHLSYAVIVPILGLLGAVGLLRTWRADRASRPRLRRLAAVSAGLLLVCWTQPLVEQVAGDGPGNLGRIVTNAGGARATVGLPLATRLGADVLAAPPFWARPSFSEAFRVPEHGPVLAAGRPNVEGLPSTGAAAVGLGMIVAAFAAGAVLGRSRPDGRAAALVPVLVLLAVGTTAILPVTGFGVAQHQMRFLWPAAVFTTWAAVLLVAARVPQPRWVVAPAVAAVIVLSGAALPHWNPRVGPAADANAMPVVRDLRRDLHRADLSDLDQPVLFDLTEQRFAEPYTAPVMATLQELHVEFRVADEGMVGQLGTSRRSTGAEAVRVVVREGDGARSFTSGRRVAFATALSSSERAELFALRGRNDLAPTESRRLAELERRWARLTVAVFVAPVVR